MIDQDRHYPSRFSIFLLNWRREPLETVHFLQTRVQLTKISQKLTKFFVPNSSIFDETFHEFRTMDRVTSTTSKRSTCIRVSDLLESPMITDPNRSLHCVAYQKKNRWIIELIVIWIVGGFTTNKLGCLRETILFASLRGFHQSLDKAKIAKNWKWVQGRSCDRRNHYVKHGTV